MKVPAGLRPLDEHELARRNFHMKVFQEISSLETFEDIGLYVGKILKEVHDQGIDTDSLVIVFFNIMEHFCELQRKLKERGNNEETITNSAVINNA